MGSIICEALHKRDDVVIVADLTPPIIDCQINRFFVVDIRNEFSIYEFVKRLESEYQYVSTLIICVDKFFDGDIDANEEDWEELFLTNLIGYAQATRLLLPMLVKSEEASIINITTSVECHEGRFIPYKIVKDSVPLLTKCISKELGPRKIRVNCVSLVTKIIKNKEGQYQKQYNEKLLIDAAEVVRFLSSAHASHITAENILVS